MFSALRELGPRLAREPDSDQILTAFNGLDVERWMLKTAIGAASAGVVEADRGWVPPAQWVRILFGRRGMPPRMGLWLSADTPGQVIKGEHGASFAAVWDNNVDPPELAGLVMTLAGFQFRILMRRKGQCAGVSMAGLFRPGGMRLQLPGESREALLILGWPASALESKMLHLVWGKDAPPPITEV